MNTIHSIVYTVADLEAVLAEAKAAGATVADAPKDVGGGLVATVSDPNGNLLGLIQRSDDRS